MRLARIDKSFWMVCITHMFLEIYLITQVTLIPVYIAEFNLSIFEASIIVTVQSLVGLSMNFPAGLLADRFSVKHLLFISMMIEGVSALFLSQSRSFLALVLGVAVMRISSPIYHITGVSQISKRVKGRGMSKSMGFHNAFGSLGTAIGGISLSIFLLTVGWRWIYLFWSLPVIAWGFILLRTSQLETRRVEKREVEKANRLSLIFKKDFLVFLMTIGIRQVGITGTLTFMTTYLVNTRGLSKSIASVIFGLGPVIGVFGSLSGGYLGAKIGAKKTLSLTILGSAISILMLAISSEVYLLSTIYIFYSFFDYSVWAPMNTIVADLVPVTEKGIGYSTFFFTEGLMRSITPTIVAIIIQFYGLRYIFPFGTIFLVTSLVVLQYLPC